MQQNEVIATEQLADFFEDNFRSLQAGKLSEAILALCGQGEDKEQPATALEPAR